MFWPARELALTPLHENELDLDHEVNPSDVAIWAAIPGQKCDSTRAEIIAATAMLAAPTPCHVGIDNLKLMQLVLQIAQFKISITRQSGLTLSGS